MNGVIRRRVISPLRDIGEEVVERTLTYGEVVNADEIFSTGNYGKVTPVSRIDDRNLKPGSVFRKARELYLEFALQSSHCISRRK